MEFLSDLEDWLKQMKNCMNQEKEKVLKASSAAQVTEILQNFQVLKPPLFSLFPPHLFQLVIFERLFQCQSLL